MNRAQRSNQVSASAPPEPDPSQLQDACRGVWMRVPCFQVLGDDLMRCEDLTSRMVWVWAWVWFTKGLMQPKGLSNPG